MDRQTAVHEGIRDLAISANVKRLEKKLGSRAAAMEEVARRIAASPSGKEGLVAARDRVNGVMTSEFQAQDLFSLRQQRAIQFQKRLDPFSLAPLTGTGTATTALDAGRPLNVGSQGASGKRAVTAMHTLAASMVGRLGSMGDGGQRQGGVRIMDLTGPMGTDMVGQGLGEVNGAR